MKTIAVDSTTSAPLATTTSANFFRSSSTIDPYTNTSRCLPTVYEELMQAPSKGAYFNHSIRPRFDFALVKAASLS